MACAPLCFVGDSIVLGTGDDRGLGWVGRICSGLRARWGFPHCYNLGVASDTVVEISARWRVEVSARADRATKPMTVFSFGLNDATLESGVPRVDLYTCRALARNMLLAARQLGPVLWIGPTPVDDEFGPRRVSTGQVRTRHNRLVARYNDSFRTDAGKIGVPFLDLFTPLIQRQDWPSDLLDDVHPTSAGYETIAREVRSSQVWRALEQMIEAHDG